MSTQNFSSEERATPPEGNIQRASRLMPMAMRSQDAILESVSAPEIRVAVLMTCYNRREVTLHCLAALFAQERLDCTLRVFLVDDASTDGTAQALAHRYPDVRLYNGSGSLFWNRGMHAAFGHALDEDFDYYLWLNDDTILTPTAIGAMLDTASKLASEKIEAIVVGNTRDSTTGQHTYGGMLKGRGLRPGAFSLATPSSTSITACDTMNGNCTLIPRAVAQSVGNLDISFHHNFGDLDYGLRAKARGLGIYMAPGFVGECNENSRVATWKDPQAGFSVRWAHLTSPKGCPWSEWSVFSRRHLGPLWFLYAVSPYVKVILQSAVKGLFGRAS